MSPPTDREWSALIEELRVIRGKVERIETTQAEQRGAMQMGRVIVSFLGVGSLGGLYAAINAAWTAFRGP